jgi:hypothetical protein
MGEPFPGWQEDSRLGMVEDGLLEKFDCEKRGWYL